ncbi:MAG: B12-binding domain-containing radical SAM protein [Elusimicrobiota bacterium]
MTRRAKVTLVQAPVFSRLAPSNGLALLKAQLQAAGTQTTVHDSSLSLRRSLKTKGIRWTEYLINDGSGMLGAIRGPFPGYLESLLDKEAVEILAHAPDIVGFTVQQDTEECSLELARRVKDLSPKTAVVFGGPQCIRETKAFELARNPWVDAVALAEADHSFAEFARAFDPRRAGIPRLNGFLVKDGDRVVDCGDPAEVEDLDGLSFMDFGDFDMSAYTSDSLFLTASRGCVRKCTFCTDIVQRKTFRRMSAERIVAEIRHQLRLYPDRHFVRFADSLINGDVRLVARLSELLVPFRLEMAARRSGHDFGWGGMAIIHPTMAPALLKKMRQGGCQTLAYGFESGSQKVVDLMRKNFRVGEAEKIIRDTKAAGIRVQLFVMVGYPGETDEDFAETLAFLERNADSIDIIESSLASVLKGSHLETHQAEYGIRTDPAGDPRRWSSIDGANTYAARSDRYQALMDTIRRYGFQTGEDSPKMMSKDVEAVPFTADKSPVLV